MSRKFVTSVDFSNIAWINSVLETAGSSDPSGVIDGRIWYDSVTGTVKVRIGGTTVDLRKLDTMTGTLTAAKISDFAAAVQALRWASMQPPNAAVAMNGQQFSGLATATANGQAVEYAQFQTALAGIQTGMDFKEHVAIVATTNVTVASPGATINGRTMTAGDRVLLTAQTTASQNGIWTWNGAATALTRPADAPTGNTGAVVAGTVVEGFNGTANSLWMQTAIGTGTGGAIIVDTDTQTWTNPFTSTLAAGYGIAIAGSKISFNPGVGMAVTGADGAAAGIDTTLVARKRTGVVPTTTSTVGGITVTVGATDSGGTGFQQITLNHQFNNLCPLFVLRYGSAGADPGQQVETDNKPVSGTDANNLTFNLPNGYAANVYQYMLVG